VWNGTAGGTPSCWLEDGESLFTLQSFLSLSYLASRLSRNAADTTTDDIPNLVEHLLRNNNDIDLAARRIYQLCDISHQDNREPMVCNGKYDVLTPLTILLNEKTETPRRRFACLVLNNLSIPTVNKHCMALGPASTNLIDVPCKVASEEDPLISYLCLMNITFLKEGLDPVLRHSPCFVAGKTLLPLDNPNSLLRVLEKTIATPLEANSRRLSIPVYHQTRPKPRGGWVAWSIAVVSVKKAPASLSWNMPRLEKGGCVA
jgi:hypothetical protein